MKTNIREYAEEMAVEIEKLDPKEGESFKNATNGETYKAFIDERLVITAFNDCGYNCTQVDLMDLLKHVKDNMPEIWHSI